MVHLLWGMICGGTVKLGQLANWKFSGNRKHMSDCRYLVKKKTLKTEENRYSLSPFSHFRQFFKVFFLTKSTVRHVFSIPRKLPICQLDELDCTDKGVSLLLSLFFQI